MYGQCAVMALLLANGAGVNKGDCDGFTALHYAARMSHLPTLESLLSKATDIEQSLQKGGWTSGPLRLAALHSSAMTGHLFQPLLSTGTGAHAVDWAGETLL